MSPSVASSADTPWTRPVLASLMSFTNPAWLPSENSTDRPRRSLSRRAAPSSWSFLGVMRRSRDRLDDSLPHPVLEPAHVDRVSPHRERDRTADVGDDGHLDPAGL